MTTAIGMHGDFAAAAEVLCETASGREALGLHAYHYARLCLRPWRAGYIPVAELGDLERLARVLCRAGLWELTEGGYHVRPWAHRRGKWHNEPTRDAYAGTRVQRCTNAGRRAGKASNQDPDLKLQGLSKFNDPRIQPTTETQSQKPHLRTVKQLEDRKSFLRVCIQEKWGRNAEIVDVVNRGLANLGLRIYPSREYREDLLWIAERPAAEVRAVAEGMLSRVAVRMRLERASRPDRVRARWGRYLQASRALREVRKGGGGPFGRESEA